MEKKSAPLLWKKAKAATFFAFIADFRRTQSPLLVQPGFPTSVADLVFKNRSLLKKPSSKSNIAPSPPSQISSGSAVLDLPSGDGSGSDAGEEFYETVPPDSISGKFNGAGIRGSRCFSAIPKVLLVVILALVTKEIAAGITASALVLLFVELVAKRLSFCRKECGGRSHTVPVNESDLVYFDCEMEKKKVSFLRRHGDSVETEKNSNGKGCRKNESRRTESNLDSVSGEKRLDCKGKVSELGGNVEQIKLKRERYRKLINNAVLIDKFLKKIAPKKFRVSKEEQLGPSGGNSVSKGGDIQKVEEKCKEMEDEEAYSSEFFSDSSSSADSEDMVLTGENMGTGAKKLNMGHLIIFVIVPFGLVGGRIIALLLTVAWFLLVKSVETGWRNAEKMY